jgi:hypothetical protein
MPSFATALKSFSGRSAATRLAAFGADATWGSATIRVVVLPSLDLEQMDGGFEPNETIKIETAAALKLQDVVTIGGKNYYVESTKASTHSHTITANLSRKI